MKVAVRSPIDRGCSLAKIQANQGSRFLNFLLVRVLSIAIEEKPDTNQAKSGASVC